MGGILSVLEFSLDAFLCGLLSRTHRARTYAKLTILKHHISRFFFNWVYLIISYLTLLCVVQFLNVLTPPQSDRDFHGKGTIFPGRVLTTVAQTPGIIPKANFFKLNPNFYPDNRLQYVKLKEKKCICLIRVFKLQRLVYSLSFIYLLWYLSQMETRKIPVEIKWALLIYKNNNLK